MIVRAAIAVAVAAAPTAAVPRVYTPQSVVSVLVDLSATWHNAAARTYNAQLLSSVGRAIAGAAPRLPKPLAIRYHVIGADSLARQPLCSMDFRPAVFGRSEGMERNPRNLERYLVDNCPLHVLRQPPEKLTEITAAIISSRQAAGMVGPAVPRILLILSDFKEESPTRYRLDGTSFANTRVVLLWRTLPEDRRRPAGLSARVERWRQLFASRGAAVSAYSDSAAISSPAAFQALLRGGR